MSDIEFLKWRVARWKPVINWFNPNRIIRAFDDEMTYFEWMNHPLTLCMDSELILAAMSRTLN